MANWIKKMVSIVTLFTTCGFLLAGFFKIEFKIISIENPGAVYPKSCRPSLKNFMAKQKTTPEEKAEKRKEKSWWNNFIYQMKKKGALISDETALKLSQQELFKHTQSND